MAGPSATQNGFWWDRANSRLSLYYRGTLVGYFDGSTFNLQSGIDLDVPDGSVDAADIADDAINGDQIAVVSNVNTEGGVPLVYRVTVAANGATVSTANTDITVVDKIRVIDAHAIHTGGNGVASDTIRVFNGTTAITDAMSWSGTDTTVVRAATINDATYEVAASGTLRVQVVNASDADDTGTGEVVVMAIKVT